MQTENADLFYGIPWSHGSLGFLVAAELKIVPAKKYVRITYEPAYNLDQIVKTFTEKASCSGEGSCDFVECLAFSRNEAVVTTGMMTDHAEKSKVNVFKMF